MSARARVGVVGVVLAAGLAAGHATAGPNPRPPEPQQVPVVGATAVCPDVRQEGERGATAVTAAGGAGRTVAPLGAPPALAPDGAVARDLAPDVSGPVVVTATGEQAGALLVEQATRAVTGSRRGVAAVTCSAPSTSSWFVGGATVVGSVSELHVVNVEDTAALVAVRTWTADGPGDVRPGRGLTVAPRSRLVVPLDRLAPDSELLALHVQATRGRVAAALRVVRTDGRTPLGTDWVPAAQAPAREVVVPGLPEGPGRRTALITNPGSDDALVAVELTTQDGQYVPQGLEAVAVPAGTSVSVDLSEQLAQTPAAMRVRSDGAPVLAGASVVDRQDNAVREISFASAAPALTAPGWLADVRLSAPTEVTLLLSALDADAVVELVPAPRGTPQRVEVAAGTTVDVRLSRFLPPGSAGSLAVQVRPVSGQVHAARYSRERGARGPLTTLLPVLAGHTVVQRPVVVADPGAGR